MLFDPAPLDGCIEKQSFVDYRPVAAISEHSPIEFFIPASDSEYVDLRATSLSMTVQLADVGKATGFVTTEMLIGPANLLIASAFQDAQLWLNGSLVEGGSFLYPYKAYLCTLLEHGSNTHKQVLRSWGFYKENDDLKVSSSNEGFVSRSARLAQNGKWSVRGPLFLDMMRQSRFLMPNVDMRLVLHPSPAKWLLMQAAGDEKTLPAAPRMKILSAQLTLRRVLPAESVRNGHALGLRADRLALYPLRMVTPITYTIPSGVQSHVSENLFHSVVPSLLVFGFVKNSAFNGSLTENPLKFMNPKLSFLGVYVDGQSVPGQPMQFPDGKLGDEEYSLLLQQLGIGWGGVHEIGFDAELYPTGYSLFAFSLSAALGGNGTAQVPRTGSVRVEVRLSAAQSSVMNVLAFGIFDRQLSISGNGKVTAADFHAL
jgi:hypothetical protein